MLLYGQSQHVAAWVAARIAGFGEATFGEFQAIGVTTGGDLSAGAVYHTFHPEFRSIEFTFAVDRRRWFEPGDIAGLMAYPFRQLNVWRLWAATANPAARRLALSAGFKIEGVARAYFGPEKDAFIVSMLRPEWAAMYGDK